MKKNTLRSKALGKLIILPALALVAITIDSCKKDKNEIGVTTPAAVVSDNGSAKSAKINSAVAKALRDVVVSGAISVQQTGAGGGSNIYSNVAINVSISSTPTSNIYSWSNPAGTSFVLTATSTIATTGGGVGQLSYNGKSFDFGYVLCIKASSKDTTYNSIFNGRELRGIIAFEGVPTANDLTLKSLAYFLVDAKGGDGKYNFVDWSSTTINKGEAIGQILDFSDLSIANIGSIPMAKILYTTNGSIDVTPTSFTLSSDAVITDIITNTEYPISGSFSCQ